MIDNAVALIKDSAVLKLEDLATIHELRDELMQTWETAQVFRTRVEMEYSVLNDMKHPTPDAKYWQCVREQNVMFGELVGLSYEYRKNAVKIQKLQRKLANETDDLESELLKINIERKTFMSQNMERTAKDRIREIREWHELKAALLPALRHGIENVNDHQAESLPMRFANMAGMVNSQTAPADAANLLGLHLTAQNRAKTPLSLKVA